MQKFLASVCFAAFGFAAILITPAEAVSTRVVATVNDNAISEYQVRQRMKLLKVMGEQASSESALRKMALEDLIDEILKRQEAKRLQAEMSVEQIDKMISGSQGLQSISQRLKEQGMSERLVKQYIITRVTWNRIVSGRFGSVKVDDAQIDARHKQIVKDINKQVQASSVKVYKLLPIDLPIAKQPTKELTQEVARSRLIEADRIAGRFKGCGSLREATSGVFNVKVGKAMLADPRKMPKQTVSNLKKLGAGNAAVMGVTPDMSAVQMIAFCGTQRMAPPAPKVTRDDVRTRLENDRYKTLGKSYIRDLRRNAFIEYKDKSYSN